MAAILLPFGTSAVIAADFKLGPLTISQPWARATPPGAEVAGGYVVIRNTGTEADRLVAATAEIAGRAELHETAEVDGVARMRPIENGVGIPAGGGVALEPGGYHLMLMELTEPLKEGDSFAGTLTFENAGTVDITYEVAPIGAREAPAQR